MGLIIVVAVATYILYKLIQEHIDEKFEELKEWLKENNN
jgi:hypothetical protein